MSVKINNGKVVYVEPNIGDDFMTYDSRNLGTTYKSPSLEDMCIVVDLDVEVKGRTYSTSMSGNAQNVTRMSWQSSVKGEKVSFMRGTKIPTRNLGDINSLTTSYTDIHLTDIEDNGTAEMFGIKSIDISYNNYMVPEVTIQFVDVRGVSLFAQEEMRHNMTNGNMNGLVNNNIEGSFFKCFFTFPYPKFTLKVKGYYGQMVSYELTCADFRAAFDSNTGNFEVTARFIGYAFSFLNDVMVNALVASPYSEYLGKQYWEENVDNERFYVEDRGGGKVAMQKLGTIVSMYKDIQRKVAQGINEYGYAGIMRQMGYSDDAANMVEESDISPLRNEYRGIIDTLNTIENKLYNQTASEKNNTGDCTIRPSDTHSRVFIMSKPGEMGDELDDLSKSVDILYNKIKEAKLNFQALEKWVDDGNFIYIKKSVFGNDKIDVQDETLRKAVIAKGSLPVNGQEGKLYCQLWEGSSVYTYNDGGLWDILGREVEVSANMQRESNALKVEVEQRLLADEFNKVFNFEPSVENVTRIVMAHVETFVHMVSQCADNITGMGVGRAIKNLGVPIEQFKDLGQNNATGCDEDTLVAPFPKVTHIHEENGIKREEGEWIGNINGVTMNKFEEIQLVEGILNSIAEAANDLNRSVSEYEAQPPTTGSTSIAHPLTYNDLFLKDGESPWGQPDFTDINDILGRFCVRAFVVLGAQNRDVEVSDVKSYGMADAENFMEMFEDKESMTTLASQIGAINEKGWDTILDLLSSNKKADDSKNNLPWSGKHSLISEVDKYRFRLNLGTLSESTNDSVIPVKDWNFQDVEKLVPYNEEKITSIEELHKYIRTSVSSGTTSPMLVIQNIETMEQPVQYLKNCYNKTLSLASEDYRSDFIGGIFNGTDFSFNGISENYDYSDKFPNGVRVLRCSKNNDTAEIDCETIKVSGLQYDSNGDIYNIDDLTLYFANFFLNEEYMKLSVDKRAKKFLWVVFSKYKWNNDWSKNTMFELCKTNPTLMYMPMFGIADDASEYDQEEDLQNKLRKNGISSSIIRTYKNQLYRWIYEYNELEKPFILEPKEGVSLSDIVNKIKDWRDNGEAGFVKAVKDIRDSLKNPEILDTVYWVRKKPQIAGVIGNLDILPRCGTDAIMKLIKSAFRIIAVCTKTKFNFAKVVYDRSGVSYKPLVGKSEMKGYMEGVVSMLNKRLEKYKSNTESTVIPMQVKVSSDPDDIKAGVYAYIKLLYDKWIASSDDKEFYKMERMFDNANPTFHFIDSVYTKIGKTTYLNLSSIVDRIVQSQHSNGYTLLSLLSYMYSDNKFLFLCIQNFLDMSKPDLMEKVFKPVPYVDMVEPGHHPNFIVMQPYEPSSKLDVPGADYPDDGFYLNDEKSWPELIKGKPDGDPIPAFGVCYGQQYQNYFKDIQVDMSAPMVTEQSIKAKFMIAGAYNDSGNNGTVPITAGQDLYTIYANNSYTCTVTMMGCAWIQPMMYFVLQNIPMFHGSYMIVKVNHRIQPGNMVTTFKGVRMANTATRAVKRYLFGGIMDSVAGIGVDSYVTPEAGYANIANNCDYAYYDPKDVSVANFTEKAAQAYCSATYKRLTEEVSKGGGGLTPEQAKGLCANIYEESNFNPFTITIDHNKDNTQYGVGGGLCGFYIHGKAPYLFQYVYGNEGAAKLDALNKKVLPYWKEGSNTLYSKVLAQHGIFFTVPFENQLDYIVTLVNGDYREIKNKNTETEAAKYWLEYYEKASEKNRKVDRWNKNGTWVNDAIASESKVSQSDIETSASDTSLAEGLRLACQESLRASQYHRDVTVSMTQNGNNYELKASGPQKNTALMDCLLGSYSQWYSKIYWNVGTGQANADAVSIDVHVVDQRPEKLDIYLATEGDMHFAITKREELNEGLRKVLTKYFKNNKITQPEAIRSIFSSCGFSDEDTISAFELESSGTTMGCNEVMGADYTQVGEYQKGDGSYNIDAACNFLSSRAHYESTGCCARYVREAMEAGGMNTTGRPEWAWKYIGYLPKKGFKHVGRFYGKNIDNPQKGDIAVYKKNGATGVPGHICMYDGSRWISDFRQNNMVVYQNPQTVDIFRYSTDEA